METDNNLENPEHLVPIKDKISKNKKDEIALITGKKTRKWIVRINEPKRIRWDIFIMILATWNSLTIPIEIAFEPSIADHLAYKYFNNIIDFIFLLDIIVTFRTTYINPSSGDEISEPLQIAKEYLKGRFWIDVLATLPFELMHGGNKNLTWTNLFGLLKTTRVLRLKRITMFVNIPDDFTLIYFLVLYLHIIGCTWFLIYNLNKVWIPPQDYQFVRTWIYEEDDLYLYFHSIYYSVQLLNGNEMGPRTTISLIFVSIILIVGAMVNANILGNMAVIIQERNKKAHRFQEKIDIANTAMKNLKINSDLQRKVINYLLYTQSNRDQQRELETFKEMISPSLQMEVTRFIFIDIIKLNPILRDSPSKMIDYVLQNINTVLYLPEDYIMKQGDNFETQK